MGRRGGGGWREQVSVFFSLVVDILDRKWLLRQRRNFEVCRRALDKGNRIRSSVRPLVLLAVGVEPEAAVGGIAYAASEPGEGGRRRYNGSCVRNYHGVT